MPYALCPMPYALCPMPFAYLIFLRKAISLVLDALFLKNPIVREIFRSPSQYFRANKVEESKFY